MDSYIDDISCNLIMYTKYKLRMMKRSNPLFNKVLSERMIRKSLKIVKRAILIKVI